MRATTDILTFPSDIPLRRRLFAPESFAHPAKLHLGLLQYLVDRYTAPGETIADPMAGAGSILLAALSQRGVIAREIEPRWLSLCHENAARIIRAAGLFGGTIDIGQHDAREPWGYTADHIITSPPYGCDAQKRPGTVQDALRRRIARLAARPHDRRWKTLPSGRQHGAAGALFAFAYGDHPAQIGPWRGERYWQAMDQIYARAHVALRSGFLILIIKDHIRAGQRVYTADETAERCERVGFRLLTREQRLVHPLSLWQRRRKEQALPIVEEEDVLVFTKR